MNTDDRCTVLVTGAGGFLGGALAERLVDLGHRVRAASRHRYESLGELGVQQFAVDLGTASAPATLLQATADCDVVFHVAARTGAWGKGSEYERINVEGSRQVVEACAARGVPHLVYTSTPSVVFDGTDQEGVDESVPLSCDHRSHYTRTKAEAERLVLDLCAEQGVAVVALRPHLVWGPGDTNLLPRIVERARAGRLMKIRGRVKKQIAPTYIEDAVEAHLAAWRALRKESANGDDTGESISGRAYFVTSGERVEPWEMIDGLLESQGLAPLERTVSPRFALFAASLMELVWTISRRSSEPPLTRWVVHELTTSHWFDITRASRDLGYRPQWTISRGLQALRSAAERPARETRG